MKPTELILSRNEMLSLLKIVGSTSLAGVKLEEFQLPEEQFRQLVEEGKNSLASRGLLPVDDGNTPAAPDLVEWARCAGQRDMAMIVMRAAREIGWEVFTFNFYDGMIIEHTRPGENTHRLALIDDRTRLLQRLQSLIPLQSVDPEKRRVAAVSLEGFRQVNRLVEAGSMDEASRLAQALDMNEADRLAMIQALKDLEFSVTLSCFQLNHSEAVDAGSVSLFASEASSWGVWPGDEGRVRVFPAGIADIFTVVINWLDARDRALSS